MQTIERELTFLAASLPDGLATSDSKPMTDTYFPAAMDVHPKLRLRRNGDRYEITKKQPVNEGDASVQTESTIQLNEAEYTALAAASPRRVVKRRYELDIGGYPAEVDVFQGDLAGLVLIDFEFESQAELESFQVPACCLVDVTQEAFIAGGLLAGRSYDDIRTRLDGFGYRPLSV